MPSSSTAHVTSSSSTKYSDYVIPTSIKNGRHRISKTVITQRLSSSDEEIAASRLFHKRLFGLLVLQYSAILFLASPFALVDPLQVAIRDHPTLHLTLEGFCLGGIVITMIVAVVKGSQYPITWMCLCAMTCLVGVEFGISVAVTEGSTSGFVAIGQATTSFALILALLQFDLEWLDYWSALGVSLVASLVWIMVLLEMGEHTILTSLGIGFLGFAFVAIVLCSSYAVQKHVSADEYVLGTLFILCPEALLCIGGAKKRHLDCVDILDQEPEVAGERDRLLLR
jgi:hypothetical protein